MNCNCNVAPSFEYGFDFQEVHPHTSPLYEVPSSKQDISSCDVTIYQGCIIGRLWLAARRLWLAVMRGRMWRAAWARRPCRAVRRIRGHLRWADRVCRLWFFSSTSSFFLPPPHESSSSTSSCPSVSSSSSFFLLVLTSYLLHFLLSLLLLLFSPFIPPCGRLWRAARARRLWLAVRRSRLWLARQCQKVEEFRKQGRTPRGSAWSVASNPRWLR